ncbi:MAG: RICIN domain-containing protein [Coriobacteriales bacterium]|jgi:hypothetical protein|nr:RICIN domain-containing protein [Coriobacteriales bacterium]
MVKRLISVILAFILIASLGSIAAFADSGTPSTGSGSGGGLLDGDGNGESDDPLDDPSVNSDDDPDVDPSDPSDPNDPDDPDDPSINPNPSDPSDPSDPALLNSADTPSLADLGLAEDTIYYLQPFASTSRLIDITGASKASGATAILWSAHYRANQQFTLIDAGDGFVYVRSESSGLVLGIQGTIRSGAKVAQFAQADEPRLKWQITANTDGSYLLTSAANAGLALDLTGSADKNNTAIEVWTAHNGKAQRFYFVNSPYVTPPSGETIPSGYYTIALASSPGLVFDVYGNSSAAGAKIELWTSKSSPNQVFSVQIGGDGYYTLRPLNSGLYFDVYGASRLAGANTIQWTSSSRDNQRYSIVDNLDGTYSILPKHANMALTVQGTSAQAGSLIVTGPWAASAPRQTQQFVFQTPSTPVLGTGVRTITPHAATSKRIDIEGNSKSSGANVIVWSSNGGMNQKFMVVAADDGAYALRSLSSGLYLTAESSAVRQRPATGTAPAAEAPATATSLATFGDDQLWLPGYAIGGYTLTNKASGELLTLSGSTIVTAAANGSTSQVFSLTSTNILNNESYYTFTTAGGMVLDVGGNSIYDGGNIGLWTPKGSANQKWRIEALGGGWFIFRGAVSFKCMTISGGSKSDGANVLQLTYRRNSYEQWRLVADADGSLVIQSKSGMYLAASGGRDVSGSNVVATPNLSKALHFFVSQTTYDPFSGTYVEVNLSRQLVTYVRNGHITVQTDVVTGKPWTPTPVGTWYVMSKATNVTLVGVDYAVPVTYWMPFTSWGHGLHDADWHSIFGGDRWRNYGSHGCVNMPPAQAAKLYSYVTTGTQVWVHN